MPYGGNPGDGTAAERRDAVYLKVGDTDTAHQLLTDAEVDFFLSEAGDSILGGAVRAAKAIAARFSKQPRIAHGPSSVDPTKIAESYLALAAELEEEMLSCSEVLVGGISISDVESTLDDPDRVPNSFEIGMDDYWPVDESNRDRC